MSVIGHVHSIETCGTVDGPGIRFIIFLQGCLMRCKYCHNRDTWDLDGGKDMTVDELMTELLQYRHFIDASGGGITISGGEAMLQPEFVKAMFEACRLEGIHTCLDTNGFVRRIDETTKAVLDVADLVLLDIKQMDNKKHIDLTHVSNKYTLDFARYLAEQNQPVYLRYVVLPGYTDCIEDVHALGKFIEPMKNIEKVEMLPYHELGKHKWTAMGEIYPLDGVNPPAREKMEEIKSILLQYTEHVLY
jgi:pyruvate formate lyase activating enzyme